MKGSKSSQNAQMQRSTWSPPRSLNRQFSARSPLQNPAAVAAFASSSSFWLTLLMRPIPLIACDDRVSKTWTARIRADKWMEKRRGRGGRCHGQAGFVFLFFFHFNDIAASFPRAGALPHLELSAAWRDVLKIEALEERTEGWGREEKQKTMQKRGGVRESRVPGRRDEGAETRNDAPLMV